MDGILLTYAGFFQVDPTDKPKRRAIVDGWQRCATMLRTVAVSSVDDVYANQDAIANALNQAKGFSNLRAKFMSKLFPGRSLEKPATIDPSI